MRFGEIVRSSDVIVVARVTHVDELERPALRFDGEPEEKEAWHDHDQWWRLAPKVRVATADVVRVLEGSEQRKRVHFLAMRTWTCDASTAEVGENVLLFLTATDWIEGEPLAMRRALSAWSSAEPIYSISHSGHGRMPIALGEERSTVAGVWSAESIAEELPAAPPIDLQTLAVGSRLPLDFLCASIERLVKAQGACAKAGVRDPKTGRWEWSTSLWQDGHRESSNDTWPAAKDRQLEHVAPSALPWSALRDSSFTRWKDTEPDASVERVALLTVSSSGVRHTVRLPSSTSTAPLDTNTEDAVRAWLAVADGIGDESARSSIDAYRKLLASKR